jgi:hypothetical protein
MAKRITVADALEVWVCCYEAKHDLDDYDLADVVDIPRPLLARILDGFVPAPEIQRSIAKTLGKPLRVCFPWA